MILKKRKGLEEGVGGWGALMWDSVTFNCEGVGFFKKLFDLASGWSFLSESTVFWLFQYMVSLPWMQSPCFASVLFDVKAGHAW